MHDGLRFMTWWLRRPHGMCRSRLCWFWSLWWPMQRRRGRLSHRLRWGSGHRLGDWRRYDR